MINFPDSPTVGQVFSSVGASWQWTGAKWESVSPAVGIVNDVGRNLIHNSLFNIAQRGAGPFTLGGYTLDRWQLGGGPTVSVTQLVLTDADRTGIGDEAAKFAMQSACTGTAGAGDYVAIMHYLEDVRRLSNKTATLSFWARATSGTPKIGVEFQQSFGAGGSPSAQVILSSQVITLSTTWTRYVITTLFPSVAGKTFGTTPGTDTFGIVLWQSSGSNLNVRAGSIGVQSFTLQLWGVQLEIGTVATPLEKPDPQQDLAKCQRFYQLVNVTVRTLVTQGWYYDFPVTFPAMRVTPTAAVVTAGTLVNVTSQNMYPANNISVRYEINSTASGDTAVYNSSWSLSADL